MSDKEPPPRSELAQDRTHLAEDRTLLANERTFSGWARTSLATIGVGLGFNVLFGELDPPWAPKAIATLFIVLGIVIIAMAERRACAVTHRLSAHKITSLPPLNLRLIAIVYSIGAAALIAALWLLA
jgi:putative membrane protein